MVALLNKTTRLSRGIDTIERQIIYAALASREASSGIEAYTESIKIAGHSTPSDSTAPSLLTIGVILDCARNNAFHSYLNILENINPYSTVTPPQYDTVPASTGLVEELPTEPNTVDTLEKLLYWSGLILGSSTYPSLDYFSQASAESSEGFQIAITITLPIDYGKYLLTNNLVESSIKIFDYHILTPDQILSPWTIPPSIQFWGDPIADIVTLKESTGQALGSTHWVTEKGAQYTLIDSLPVGSAADDDLFVTPTTQAETEVWKKGGTGQGTGNGTSMTAGQIRDALESLTATSRLDASAIQNLPTTQTAAQIRNALGGLTGSDRLDASAIQNLPSGGTPGADGADGADGKNPEFQFSITHLQYRLSGDTNWIDLIPITDIQGDQGIQGVQGNTGSNGKSVELKKSATHLQWRLVGDTNWINLIPITDIQGDQGIQGVQGNTGSNGKSVELQKSATHLQWRLVGDTNWINLIPLADLKGDPGTGSQKTKNVASVSSTVTLTLLSAYQQFLTPTVAIVDVICPSLSSGDYFEIEIINKHATNALVVKDSASNILGTLSSTATEKDRWVRLFWDGTDLNYLPLGGY
jgi:hypothetical protein